MSSFSASRAACSGAAPPKAIIVRSPSVAPISMAWTRAALAMFSPTISLTPSAAICGSRSSGAPTPAEERIRRRLLVERDAPARELGRVDAPHRKVGIGNRGLGAALAVAGRPRLGARALRPHGDAAEPVDDGDGAAARADLHHLDHGDAERQPAALEEAMGTRDLEGPCRSAAGHRRSGRSWRSCRPCRRRARGRARIAGRCGSRRRRRPPARIRRGEWGSGSPSRCRRRRRRIA